MISHIVYAGWLSQRKTGAVCLSFVVGTGIYRGGTGWEGVLMCHYSLQSERTASKGRSR